MKTLLVMPLVMMAVASTAMADFNLAASGKTVVCSADDNQTWVLNAKRTTVKYTVEGESLGAQKITKRDSDGDTFVSYTVEQGTLTLSDRGDTFQFDGDQEAGTIDCK